MDCGQSWSTRSGHPWATGTDRASASCRSSRQLNPTPSSNLLGEITGFQPPNSKIEVSHQPLASSPIASRRQLVYSCRLSCESCAMLPDEFVALGPGKLRRAAVLRRLKRPGCRGERDFSPVIGPNTQPTDALLEACRFPVEMGTAPSLLRMLPARRVGRRMEFQPWYRGRRSLPKHPRVSRAASGW